MILSEKYDKTVINNKVYNTVLLADVVEIQGEKYFVSSGYLFDSKKLENENNNLDESYLNDTFFKREESEDSDIDAYYLIYNMDKKEIVKDKKNFIQEFNLNKILKLDKTKCEQVEICKNTAFKIDTKNEQYVFVEINNEETPYILMKNGAEGLYAENMIKFNKEKNKVQITNELKDIEKKVKDIEKINISKLAVDANSVFKKIIISNKEAKEEL